MSKWQGFLLGWKSERNAYFAVFLPESFSPLTCNFYAVSKPQWFSFCPMNFILLSSTVLFWWLLKGDVFWIFEQLAFWSSLHLSQFATLAGRAAQIRVIDTTWYGWCWRWISSWPDNKQLFPDFLNMVKMIVVIFTNSAFRPILWRCHSQNFYCRDERRTQNTSTRSS